MGFDRSRSIQDGDAHRPSGNYHKYLYISCAGQLNCRVINQSTSPLSIASSHRRDSHSHGFLLVRLTPKPIFPSLLLRCSMFDALETCERYNMSGPGAKTPPPSTRKSSPLSQLFKLASLRSRKPPSATDEGGEKLQDFAPPEFPTADPDNTDDLPVAPSPSVFVLTPLSAAGNVGEEDAPTLSQAATHLALLEIFWNYKDRYLNPDDEVRAFFGAAFGWRQDRKWTSEDCEMLWRLVVEIAVGRFEAWWKIVGREMEAATWDKESTKAGHRWESKDGPSKAVSELPPDMLPPVGMLRGVGGEIGFGC